MSFIGFAKVITDDHAILFSINDDLELLVITVYSKNIAQ
jgi:hypothetical protein